MAESKVQPDRKFDPCYYVDAFRMARDGHPDHEIAKALGVSGKTFRRWKKRKGAFAYALVKGRENNLDGGGLEEYLFERLSPALRPVWRELVELRAKAGGGPAVKKLLEDKGVRARQFLFLHALAKTKFNVSQAMKVVGITLRTYEFWRDRDPDFAELVREMEFHKAEWYKHKLHGLMEQDSEAAILHAVRSVVAGYGAKVVHEQTGSVEHTHRLDVVDYARIAPFLSVSAKRELVTAMDRAQLALAAPIEDAEFQVKEVDDAES